MTVAAMGFPVVFFKAASLVPRFRGDFQFKMAAIAKLAFCGPLL
jgi:hypothetical protein